MGSDKGTRQGQTPPRTSLYLSPSPQTSSTMRPWQRPSCSFMSIQPKLCGTSSWRPPGTMSPTSPRKIVRRWCGTTSTPAPSPLALLRGLGGGLGGNHTFCPLSRAKGKREAPKYMSKQTVSSGPFGSPKRSLGKSLLFLSPCRYHLLAFKDQAPSLLPLSKFSMVPNP